MNATVEAATIAAAAPGLPLQGLRLASWLPRIVTVLRAVGPYALIEILLPGGTLIAISLWLYRRYAARKAAAQVSPAAAFASFLRRSLMLRPCSLVQLRSEGTTTLPCRGRTAAA